MVIQIVTHIDKNRKYKLWYFIKGFVQFLWVLPSYDLVHIHTSEPPSALRKCLFISFAKICRKKVIVHFHAFSPDTTVNSKYRWIYHYLFNRADRVIVLSEMWKEYVNNALQLNDKLQVIYNPCTTEILKEKHEKKNIILYAGTLNIRKGYADMIKAFALVAKTYPDWLIVFAGNGEIEQGRKLSEKLGINKQTEFLGWVNGYEKDKAFKEATIFCLPSYAEGFPMAVLDAWAYGLPVITTPVGGIPDIAKDGKNLLLFKPGDIKSLADQLEKLISNKLLREDIAKESKLLASTTFNLETINNEIAGLYEQLLKK